MSLNRVLRYLNWIIVLLVVAAAAVTYWFVWRVLPKTEGRLDAPVAAEVRIVRDERGMPHITAGNLDDALFAQGYATAQDRLWQMDALRRLAGGTLAEVAGSGALQSDRETRLLRLRRVAEAQYQKLDPAVRSLLGAYARGVNHFIATHENSLPLEFTLLDYEPEPWSVVDTMLVGLHMYRDLTFSWRHEIQKATLLAQGNPQLVAQLYPPRGGLEIAPGSNAWAVSGKHTATGKPILASDPHLQFGIPSTWYMVHLKSPQLDVAGVTLPGVPGVIVGHNQRIAWGVTNLHFDVQDLYLERLDTRTGAYLMKGELRRAAREREVIAVKGGRPVELANWITEHGPIWLNEGQRPIALRWVASEPDGFDFPFLALNTARNWDEFRAALRRFPGPAQNFVYADVDGNIGYQAAGRLPIRRNFTGDVPLDGSTGQYEWDGFIPYDDLPSLLNPPGGMIVSANQNPFPADYKYTVNGTFATRYRTQQIRDLLAARRSLTPQDMLAIQKDVYSPFLHFVSAHVVKAVEARGRGDQQLAQAAGLLRNWNGQMEKGTAAPFVMALVYDELRRMLAERAAPGKSVLYETQSAAAAVEALLATRPKQWFADWDQVLVKALTATLETGRRLQGRNPEKWDYGRYLELELKHPVGSRIPWVGRYFGIGPVPLSGSSTSVKQTTRRLGPSMRFVAAVGDWDRSLLNLTFGQSGQILSGHYKDQWDEYYSGASFPLPFHSVTGDELRLLPAAR